MQIALYDLGLLQDPERSKTHCARIFWDLIPADSKDEPKERLMLSMKKISVVSRTDLSPVEANKVSRSQTAFEENKKEEFHLYRPGERWPPPNLLGIVPVFFYSARASATSEARSFIHFFPVNPEILDFIAQQESDAKKGHYPSLADEKLK